MRNRNKLLTLLLTLAVLVGAMTITASAAEFSQEDAFAYLDSYADNVGVDEDFDENIAAALAAAREKGLVRMEGKEYVVQDGDVILFRFNV